MHFNADQILYRIVSLALGAITSLEVRRNINYKKRFDICNLSVLGPCQKKSNDNKDFERAQNKLHTIQHLSQAKSQKQEQNCKFGIKDFWFVA